MLSKPTLGILASLALGLTATGPASAFSYQHDDGVVENSIGLANGGDIAWMNLFTAQPGAELIDAISVILGSTPYSPITSGLVFGQAMTIYLWDDPNNDGNPADAVVLTSVPHNIVNFDDNVTPDLIAIAPTLVSGNFFVGALITHAPAVFPAGLDQTAPTTSGVSWVAANSAAGTLNPNALGSADFFGTIGSYPIVGNWAVRANGGPVPEPASLGLMVAGLAGLGAFARRRAG